MWFLGISGFFLKSNVIMQGLTFWQQCWWRLTSSGMWCHVCW